MSRYFGSRAKFTVRQQQIKRKFVKLWYARYGKSPDAVTVAVVLSLLIGELGLRVEEPLVWPLCDIVPLLRQAVQEATDASG
jgi:hypothetical protein